MGTIDINQLSAEDKAALYAQMKAEETTAAKRKESERQMYKELVSKQVEESIAGLTRLSSELSLAKQKVFGNLQSLIEMKQELFKVKSDQQSFTFSNKESTVRITIGYRVLDRYDDTASDGIALVREYMDSLSRDAGSAKLVRIINNLLKRDKDGNLKANRVMELHNIANDPLYDTEAGIATLRDGVDIIMKSHKPEQSAYFVEAQTREKDGTWMSVPLSISSAAFQSGFSVEF